MHHGFYDPDEVAPGSGPDHRAAQSRMIQEALSFAGVSGLLHFFSSLFLLCPSQLPKKTYALYIKTNVASLHESYGLCLLYADNIALKPRR